MVDLLLLEGICLNLCHHLDGLNPHLLKHLQKVAELELLVVAFVLGNLLTMFSRHPNCL